MLLIGKPSISIRAIYAMAMLNNLRVHLSYTQWTNGHQMDQPSIHRKTTKNLLADSKGQAITILWLLSQPSIHRGGLWHCCTNIDSY